MTRAEAVNWLINIMSDIGKSQHRDLWHYEQALAEIKKILEEEPHWISCSEQLPELYERVLITDGEDVEMSRLCRMSGDGYVWLFEKCWNDYEDWPYWMPLPEPYKEGDVE